MLQKIVDSIIQRQLKNHTISAEDENIYRYGYILLGEVILNSVIALIIGIFFMEIKTVAFFLCAYIPLRSFCGGWHADKIWICTIISNVILLLQIYLIKNILPYMSISYMFPILIVNMICIFLLAPVETKMKKISENEKYTYKKRIKWILAIHLVITLIMAILMLNEFVFSMMYVYLIQNVMLLLEIVNQKVSFLIK